MAVAPRPAPSDARVPCPLCGGLIHPIAGRCKHCKADLASYRAARPAAAAPLPALRDLPPAAQTVMPHAATAVPMPAPREPSRPVLPPRPTMRGQAPVERASGWRSWPVLVIVVATIAIVIAAVLMVWPPGASDPGTRAVQPPPAPERMDTQNPGMSTPPKPSDPHADPWGGHSQAQPAPTLPVQPAPTVPAPVPDQPQEDPPDWQSDPDAHAQQAPADPDDLLADPNARRNRLSMNGRGMVMLAMAEHLCRKMVQCGNDDLMTKNMCDTVSRSGTDVPRNCPAATRCLQHIDQMSCASGTDDLSQLTTLLTQFRDCADAVRC